jgi:two-component system, chemotaxis family, protein-glutamate methylesterase/glutaminase
MAQKELGPYELLVVGGSAGSLEVILQFLPRLSVVDGLAIVVIVHRKNADSMMVDLFRDKSSWEVREPEEKEKILPGVIYIAPADYHLLIEKDKTFSLDYSERIHYSRPAIDASFETAADAYGSHLAGLLLSGANADGAQGLKAIAEAGGLTLVQDPDEALVSFMPQQALDLWKAHKVIATTEIADAINQLNK